MKNVYSNKNVQLDAVMKKLHSVLCADLYPSHKYPSKPNVAELREMRFTYNEEPSDIKKCSQLNNLFKRYIFADDLFSPDELAETSLSNFKEQQQGFGIRSLNTATKEVAKRAKEINTKILGEFSFIEFWTKCKWGKRAAVGLTRRESYLDNRVKTVTGSTAQWSALKKVSVNDFTLDRILKKSNFSECSSAQITCVPKTWKTHRIIGLDSIAGGFLSAGLGRYVRARLESGTHINLATAPDNHKRLACAASKDGYYATGDLSRASDSFVLEHLQLLLPESWHPVLDDVRLDNYRIDGEDFPLRSYMLMGSGHTFPLQTLLFYSILRAIADLAGIKDKVYVFGDDLMYPSRMHNTVHRILDNLGFDLNKEKSFSSTTWGPCFRESCGGDYYHGLDVRPYMPEFAQERLSKNAYIAQLHKVMNGLLCKWSIHEIPNATNFLSSCLLEVCDGIAVGNPGVHAEYSAVLFDLPAWVKRKEFKSRSECCINEYGSKVLCYTPARRKVRNELIYVWDSTRDEDPELPFIKREFTAPRFSNGKQSVLLEVSKAKPRYKWRTVWSPDHAYVESV